MVTISDFEMEFISIVDRCIDTSPKFSLKEDYSVVTDADVLAEKNLIAYIENNFPDIVIISEENPASHRDDYLLDNRFAIIDPIDGTENYFFTNQNYGSVVSVVYDEFIYHGIYIPSLKKVISTQNIDGYRFEGSSIKLLSTSCLGSKPQKIEGSYQNYRVLGSSSYMFFMLLMGQASSYDYCGKAKIWDSFTGISLALEAHEYFEVSVDGMKVHSGWYKNSKLKHKAPFNIKMVKKND
jgi:3'-phosphoadenosine 5'-phosphosulfate (PAPS) 3'-phosphatase